MSTEPISLTQKIAQRTDHKRRQLLIGALSFVVIVAIGVVAYFSPLMSLRSVTVHGTEITDPQAVEEVVLQTQQGRPLPQIRLGQLGAELQEQFSTAKTVRVRWSGIQSLRITVVDRQPVVTLQDGQQWIRYDEEGIEIDRVSQAPDLPVITEAGNDPAALAAALDLMRQLSAKNLVPVVAVYAYASDDLRIDYSRSLATQTQAASSSPPTASDASGTASVPARQDQTSDVVQIRFGTSDTAEAKYDIAINLIDRAKDYVDVSVPNTPVTK